MKTDIRSFWVDWRTTQSRILTLGHGVEDSLRTLDGQKLIVVIPGAFQDSSQSSILMSGEVSLNPDFVSDNMETNSKELRDISVTADLSMEDSSQSNFLESGEVSLSLDSEKIIANSKPVEVEDIICRDINSNLKKSIVYVEEAVDQITDLFEADSDWEDGDSPEFTRKRIAQKTKRHDIRNNLSTSNLLESDGNRGFISRLKNHIANKKIGGISEKGKKPKNDETDKIYGHLVKYHDSFFNYELKNLQ